MRTSPFDLVLFDAVSLRHLAVAGMLDLCGDMHSSHQFPRWTEAVSGEIHSGAEAGIDDCITVRECAWLGSPAIPEIADLESIWRLKIALGDGAKNDGEAESIYFAERLGGCFVTDDGVAHDFARRRLGPERVFDTVDLLQRAVDLSLIGPSDAAYAAGLVSDSGRHLRRGRPEYPGSTYFES